MLDTCNIKLITEFMIKELRMNLSETCFFKLKDGSYELFNKFLIKKEENSYRIETSTCVKHFNYLKNAVTWCILYKRNLLGEMLILEELDMRLVSIELNIKQHLRLCKRAKTLEDKLLFLDKLNEDKLKQISINKELNFFINDAKEWQLKQFANTKI